MFNNNLKYRILNLSFKMRYFYAPLSIQMNCSYIAFFKFPSALQICTCKISFFISILPLTEG